MQNVTLVKELMKLVSAGGGVRDRQSPRSHSRSRSSPGRSKTYSYLLVTCRDECFETPYTVTRIDVIFRYPDRVPLTHFVHRAKKVFEPEFSVDFSAPPEFSGGVMEKC
jgi:hypothetical protein